MRNLLALLYDGIDLLDLAGLLEVDAHDLAQLLGRERPATGQQIEVGADEALALDTTTADQIINKVKAAALREAAEFAKKHFEAPIQERAAVCNWLRRMADELEKK